MASKLPLPFVIAEPLNADDIQSNFEAITKAFPLSRKNMKVEAPHVVGASGEPAFQNSWVAYDSSTRYGARFWKDPMGLVHVEAQVKNGTLTASIFTLPAGYRPGKLVQHIADSNGNAGEVVINTDGTVVPFGGSNAFFSIVSHFRQEL